MEALPVARKRLIRTSAAVLAAVSAGLRAMPRVAAMLQHPREAWRALKTRRLLWPWLNCSVKLLIGTLAYNAFVLLVVQPLLRTWFPPLSTWEHVKGVFGGTRTTYESLVPIVSAIIWIAGNGLLFALLGENLRKTHEAITQGAVVPMDSTTRLIR